MRSRGPAAGEAAPSSSVPSALATYTSQPAAPSSRCARRATAGSSWSSVEAADTARARSAMPSTRVSRRRVCSYRRAFSIAPGDEARGVDEEVGVGLGELARRLGVQRDHADHVTGLATQRHGDDRLVLLLVGLGHDLGARVGERALGQEDGLVVLGDPARQALAALEPQAVDERAVGIGHRPQHQRAVRRDQVDEAGVAVDRVGDEVDDRAQHAVEVERRGDGVDDPEQMPRLGRARGCVRNRHSENSTWVSIATHRVRWHPVGRGTECRRCAAARRRGFSALAARPACVRHETAPRDPRWTTHHRPGRGARD